VFERRDLTGEALFGGPLSVPLGLDAFSRLEELPILKTGADDEYWIPEALTRDQTRLAIRLVVHSASRNAYRYDAFALRAVGAF
jgi:hypothetical protein